MNKCCICAAVKGGAHHLDAVFLNMNKIGSIFDDYRVVIFFDHSQPSLFIDDTLERIQNYQTQNNKVTLIINPTPLHNNKGKTYKLAHARNGCIQYIRDNCPEFQYFIVMDADDVSTSPIKVDRLKKYLKRSDWDGLSFSRTQYYDLWALSMRELVYSCWHFQKPRTLPIYQTAIDSALRDCQPGGLVQVYSAFGGFAIYRTAKFIDCVYDGNPRLDLIPPFLLKKNIELCGPITNYQLDGPDQDCEHRSFHIMAKIKNNVKIAISPESLFDYSGEEHECQMVSSRGLLKSCTIHSKNPQSSCDHDKTYLDTMHQSENMSIYVCTHLLTYFVSSILPKITMPFYLVSGDSDLDVQKEGLTPELFTKLVGSPYLLKWFAQNITDPPAPKVFQMPIGFDYHTISNEPDHWWKMHNEGSKPIEQESVLNDLRQSMKPFDERICKIFSNIHHTLHRTGDRCNDRQIAVDTLYNKHDIIVKADWHLPRSQTWREMGKYSFVLSPFGNGYDCHRTWEALCMGAIPIVRAKQFKVLFADLPVLNVDEWSDVTQELLQTTIREFKERKFNYEKLTLKYWTDQMLPGL
jgi:hypothetical protein